MSSIESTASVNALVKDLRQPALDLEKDLRVRARDDEEIATRLTAEYETARAAERTAATYTDVGDLDRVVQINAPHSVASFLQRLGRTGRRQFSWRRLRPITEERCWCQSSTTFSQSIVEVTR